MKMKLIENGPIVLDTEGMVAVNTAGSPEERSGPLFLCRCGQSSTKPFCDGTHRKAGFEAPSAEISTP